MPVTRPANSSPVQPLISDTAAAVPLAAEMQAQEVGINTVDKKLFVKNLSNNVVELDFGTPLNDTLTSTSTTEGLTAAQGKVLNDKIDGIGTIHEAPDITGRDSLATAGTVDKLDLVHVLDDGDGKWARYQNTGTAAVPVWVKTSDQDAVAAGLGATNLGTTYTATTVTTTNTSGSDSVIAGATNAEAGVLPASGGVVGNQLYATAAGWEVAAPGSAGTF